MKPFLTHFTKKTVSITVYFTGEDSTMDKISVGGNNTLFTRAGGHYTNTLDSKQVTITIKIIKK